MSAFKAGAVLYAKDVERVQSFYREVVGLRMESTDEDHVILASDFFQLVVFRIPAAIAASIAIDTPPQRRTESPIKLVFPVANLGLAREKAAALGGQLNPAEREWEFQGDRICDGIDPEGNVLQLRMRPSGAMPL